MPKQVILAIRVGAEILFPSLTAISLILDALNVQQLQLPQGQNQTISWPWIALACFLIFVVLVYWRVFKLYRENEQLKSARPKIDVTVINKIVGPMFLEVTNIGTRGDFEAQIEILEGAECIHGILRPPLPTYRGYWQLNAGPRANLLQGQKDSLVVGSLEIFNLFMSFSMCFYDAVNRQQAAYGTTSWMPGHPEIQVPRFVLRVTISSEPEQLGGPLVKTYIVDGSARDHLREGYTV